MRWLAFLILASTSWAISSSQAADALGVCLSQNNPQLTNLPQPILNAGYAYWVFYSPPSQTRGLFAAVSDEDGRAVEDNSTLSQLAEGVYLQNAFKTAVINRGWSAEYLLSVLTDASRVIGEQTNKLSIFRQQTEEKYPALHLEPIEQSLSRLENQLQTTQGYLSDAAGTQLFYESNPSVEDAQGVVFAYNASFSSLFQVFDAVEKHASAVSKAESDVYRLGITDPDNKNINSNLENLREVGLSSIYSKAKAANPSLILTRALADKEKWVADGVSSFAFQSLGCQVVSAYEKAKPNYSLLVKNEPDLKRVGFGEKLRTIKEDWNRAESMRAKKTEESYRFYLQYLPTVSNKIEGLITDYKAITENPVVTPPAPKSGIDGYTV
ncbi:MAG TPA: hypothetical protein VI874_02515, partial [Candidatus Norongarragalinales archaeon]|nr:hypothetical protein [Candidatus Norongarragalinales archaeon]